VKGNTLEGAGQVAKKFSRSINHTERRLSMKGKVVAKVARMTLVAVMMASAVALAVGPAQPAYAQTLTYGQSVRGQISGYNLHEWHDFYGRAGELIRISMARTQGDLDPFVDLWFHNGSEWVTVTSDDDSGGNWNALIDGYVLPYTGKYLIGAHRCDHEYGTTAGSYLLTLTLLPGANACPAYDTDCDGFTDDFEHWLIEAFKPVLIFDEEESQCVDVVNETATVYQVTPYETAGRYGKSGALITVVMLYQNDCGAYGTGVGGHPGDTEALRIFAVHNPLHDNWYVGGILMKRHHDEWEAYKPSEFTYRGTHPKIFVSESKHAMYPSVSACEDYALWTFEDCGGGIELNLYTPPAHNVGERGAPAFDAMRYAPSDVLVRLFSDNVHTEYTWTDAPFCGGWVGTPCGGALTGKWWPLLDAHETAFQRRLIEEAVAY
jgi:hypothetical protein